MTRVLPFATCLMLALSGAGFAQTELSAEAQLILERVQKDHPAGSLCGDDAGLKEAVRDATKALLDEGVLSGMPRAQAQEAGAFIKTSCG
jgi:hypothetical protein